MIMIARNTKTGAASVDRSQRGLRKLTATLIVLSLSGLAHAQFTGPWWHSAWVLGAGTGSGGNSNASATSVTLGGNTYGNTLYNTVDYSIVVPTGSWKLAFDWEYNATHVDPVNWGGYSINGVDTVLAMNVSPPISGSALTPTLSAGDYFSFRVYTSGSRSDWDTIAITNFQVTSVPAPGAVPLLGSLGLLTMRRRR